MVKFKSKNFSASSKRWIQRQAQDNYVNQAKKLGFASRAVFKLEEIQKKYNLIKPKMQIAELGAAPGGWSELILQLLNNQGYLVAIDLLPLASDTIGKIKSKFDNFKLVQGDFTDTNLQQELIKFLPQPKLDLVVSDLSPNLSGKREVDQAAMLELAEIVLEFSCNLLKPHGSLLIKLFAGDEIEDYIKKLTKHGFKQYRRFKPQASRRESREFYLLAQDFMPQ